MSFSWTSCSAKDKEPSLHYYFLYSWEKKVIHAITNKVNTTALAKTWTLLVNSIFWDDHYCTRHTFWWRVSKIIQWNRHSILKQEAQEMELTRKVQIPDSSVTFTFIVISLGRAWIPLAMYLITMYTELSTLVWQPV